MAGGARLPVNTEPGQARSTPVTGPPGAGVSGPPDTRRNVAWTAAAALLLVGPGLIHQVRGALDQDWVALGLVVGLILAAYRWSPMRALLLLGLFSLFVDTIVLAAGPTMKYADEIVIPLLAAATLATRWREILGRFVVLRELAVILFVGAACVSSLVADVAPTVWLPGLLLVAKSLAVFYIALVHDLGEPDIRWAMRLMLVVACAVLIAGLIEVAYPAPFIAAGLPPWSGRAGLPAINSVFYHPHLFGWFCGFAALYLYAGHAVTRRRSLIVLAVLFGVGTILSARRRAILGVVAGVGAGVVAGLTERGRGLRAVIRHWAPAGASIALLAIAFLPALTGLVKLTVETYLPGSPTVGQSHVPAEDPAATPARVALLNGSLAVARDYFPLGAGLGRYGSWMSRQQYSDLYHHYGLDEVPGLSPEFPDFITDTFWPQVLGETGVFGVLGFLGFLVITGLQLVRAVHGSIGSAASMTFALGSLLVFGQGLVESLASPIYNSPSEAYLLMLAVGGTLSWAFLGAERSALEQRETGPAGLGAGA